MRIRFPRLRSPSADRIPAGSRCIDQARQEERSRLIENLIRDFDREAQDAIRSLAAASGS